MWLSIIPMLIHESLGMRLVHNCMCCIYSTQLVVNDVCAENMSREVLSLCEVLDCLLQAYQPLIQVSIHTYCGILQHSILQYTVQYTVQYTTIYYSILQYITIYHSMLVYRSILPYTSVCHSILQYTAYTTVYHSISQYITVY